MSTPRWTYKWYRDGLVWGIITFILSIVGVVWLSSQLPNKIDSHINVNTTWYCNDELCIREKDGR